ncbi:transcription factor bHLH112-like isoform X2 [Diospyros lotus]|uniref:transcription factor bHLH112-like isoform X2 n=1 Tax=Diospyros lotus TaxID=55363 RepID=UPI00224EF67B|nr:transcription factor bHLH112-like isoform X2 [Diospyros lotus]
MAEEFQAGVCGSVWWSGLPRSSLGMSPCSVAINDMGSFGWPSDLLEVKPRSNIEGSVMFQDIQQKQQDQPDSVCGGGDVLTDSALQMMGIGPLTSSTTTEDWSQTLLASAGRSENNFNSSILQDDMINPRLNFRQETGMDCPQIHINNYSIPDSTINEFKQTNQEFSLDEPGLNCATSSGDSAATCQGLPSSFRMSSASYNSYSPTLIPTLFDTDHHHQPQQSLFENGSMNYPSATNYRPSLNEFDPSLAKLSPLIRPNSLPKQPPINPFWNATTAAINDIRASIFPSKLFEEKPNSPNVTTKPTSEAVQDSGSAVKKSSSEPAFKKLRIETPSPLPTFKVRKEKLGDRITALQQLVSPFGKTDTASVLQEAIEYIKFLHDQVSVLSTPYIKNGAPVQRHQATDKLTRDSELGPKQDLRSRGLCLVPISSTLPVATETTADFWTPTFGGTFR